MARADLLLDFLQRVHMAEVFISATYDVWNMRPAGFLTGAACTKQSPELHSSARQDGTRIIYVPGKTDEEFRRLGRSKCSRNPGSAIGLRAHTRRGHRNARGQWRRIDRPRDVQRWLAALGRGCMTVSLGLNRG